MVLGVSDTVSASLPDLLSLGSVTPTASGVLNLPGFQGTYDGTVDFSAPSARMLAVIGASQSATTPIPVSLFTGTATSTGTFDVAVTNTASATIDGNGNLAVLLHAQAGATLSLQYDSAAPAGGGGPGNPAGAAYVFTNPVYPPAGSFTKPQVVTFAPQTSGWISAATIQQFNPALGTLLAVDVTAGAMISGQFAAENLGTSAAGVDMEETASLTAIVPGGGGSVTGVSNSGAYLSLGAFDGTIDLAGSSGGSRAIIDPGPFRDAAGAAYVTNAAALTAFTGTGSLALPVSTAGTSVMTGPGDLYAVGTQQTAGTVSVTYFYKPATGTPVPPSPLTSNPGWSTPPNLTHHAFSLGTVGAAALNAILAPSLLQTAPVFIGPGSPAQHAAPNETFVIGAGANVSIRGSASADGSPAAFTATQGDKLDISQLLTNAPLTANFTNIGHFVSIIATTENSATSWNQSLAINGPGGSAAVTIVTSTSNGLAELLGDHALIVMPH